MTSETINMLSTFLLVQSFVEREHLLHIEPGHVLDREAERQPLRVAVLVEQLTHRLEDPHGDTPGDNHDQDALGALERQPEEALAGDRAEPLAGQHGDAGGTLGLGPLDGLVLHVLRGDGDDDHKSHGTLLLWRDSWMMA